jgi:hypothetical protein
LHVLQGDLRADGEHVDAPGDEVGGRLGHALVGNGQDVRARGVLEDLRRDVAGRAVARVRVGELARALLRQRDELGHVLRRQRRVHHQHLPEVLRRQRHVHEVLHGVVVHVLVEGRDVGVRGRGEEQGVAVGGLLGHERGADEATRTCPVLHDDGLAEHGVQPRADGAQDEVRRPARRRGHRPP